ncbi:probable methyltransferase-like protein 24 isoform X10 [Ciconia boyciana]|uniref:probable methyltransferase-like protein 24 isoform X10 n=2 Tax=Neoaves TaxID=3078114 RepID=UPI003BA27E61
MFCSGQRGPTSLLSSSPGKSSRTEVLGRRRRARPRQRQRGAAGLSRERCQPRGGLCSGTNGSFMCGGARSQALGERPRARGAAGSRCGPPQRRAPSSPAPLPRASREGGSSRQDRGPPPHQTVRWHIELQPWASPTPSLNYEALRFLKYISTSQISCERMNLNSLRGYSETAKKPWSICLDERFSLIHRIRSKQCRLYSLGLGNDDNQFEISMANSGCEVHRFDPSIKSAHIQEGRHLWYHRLSIDWRDPNPAIAAHKLHSNTKKLGTILNEFGHQKIDVLKADVESAEWKILENLILEDVVEQIGQLVFEVHIHWPGFEVSGNDSTVVRYWYSLLRELELKDFRLFHTYKDLSKPQMFLKKEAFNASSCYTLSWVNTRWK